MYRLGCGPGTPRAAASSPPSTARSPAPPTTATCPSASMRYSYIRWRHPTAQKSRSCSRSCSSAGIKTPTMTPGRSASAKATSFRAALSRSTPIRKIPALVDRSGGEAVRIFESGAILLYLAEKFGELLPASGAARAETLSWLFWQMGSAPFLGGGFGHFFVYAPEKFEYPINRYSMEVKRQFDVLDRQLRRARLSPATIIRSPISRSGHGTANGLGPELRK